MSIKGIKANYLHNFSPRTETFSRHSRFSLSNFLLRRDTGEARGRNVGEIICCFKRTQKKDRTEIVKTAKEKYRDRKLTPHSPKRLIDNSDTSKTALKKVPTCSDVSPEPSLPHSPFSHVSWEKAHHLLRRCS